MEFCDRFLIIHGAFPGVYEENALDRWGNISDKWTNKLTYMCLPEWRKPQGVKKEELHIPLVAVWTSTGAEAFDWPPLFFLPSSPKTLSAVTPELLHSTVMPEIYDAWSGNMMEPHPILEAMFSSAQGLKILHFTIFPCGTPSNTK
jgi:hypothetical protein